MAGAALIAVALAYGANQADAQQGTPPGRFFSGPVVFGPPRVAGPFRGRRPIELPTAENVGANVNVTGNDLPQNETAIAVSYLGTLLGGANDYRDGDAKVGAYTSFDAGNSWSTLTLKLPGGLSVGADPSTAFDSLGDGYVGGIGFNRGGPMGAKDGTILVWKAQGGNFSGNEDASVVAQGSKNVFHGKSYIGVGDLDGLVPDDVFVSWTEFSLQGPFTTGFPIKFSRSLDGGETWSSPLLVSDSDATQGSVPIKGPGGLYVVFYDFGNVNSSSDDSIKLARSTTGGLNWGFDKTVANVVEIPSPLLGWGFRTNSFPSIGVHRPTGATADELYVVFASNPPGGDEADVFFTKSTDGGSSWSSPVGLNNDGETAAHQFFPWLAVAPDGSIHVVWYDTRDPDGDGEIATNEQINLFYTSSSDGGATWLADNVRVSAQGFVPNSGDQFGGAFIGDYNGVAATNPTAHPVWTGYRGQDQDIFYATVGGVPNDPPTADADGPYSGTEDTGIAFDGTGSSDLDGDTLTYNWDFGDGATGTGATPTHTYLWGGTFTVTLTVSDGNGGTDTATTSATVTEVNDVPVADANGPYSGTVNEAITFDGSASSDFDNEDGTTDNDQTLTYSWAFGDLTTGTGISPSHAYAAAGTYPITLTVNDGLVDSALSSTEATVSEGTGGANEVYVWDIVFESRTRGRGRAMHDERIAVTVRRDSDGDGVAEPSDEVVSGASVTVNLSRLSGAVGSSAGTTDSSGVFLTGWFRNLPDDTYWADVDVTLAPGGGLIWNVPLSLSREDDSNGNGLPDAEHPIPH